VPGFIAPGRHARGDDFLVSAPPHHEREEPARRWSGKKGAQLRRRGRDRRACTCNDVSWLEIWNSLSTATLEACADTSLADEGHSFAVNAGAGCSQRQRRRCRSPCANERDVDRIVNSPLGHVQEESSRIADGPITHHREDISGLQYGRCGTVGIYFGDDHSAFHTGRKGEFRGEPLHRDAHIRNVARPARGESRGGIEQIARADNRGSAPIHYRCANELTVEREQEGARRNRDAANRQ
jgi:hypothetical protein